jgi:uncharacterized protein YceH (UPF0502 family)
MNPESSSSATGNTNPDGGIVLDPFEVRVLAVLAEKEALTPDSYPLSLNALTNGCNQLSSRDPVMSISEDTVQDVLQRLIQKKLVAEVSQAGARVHKYEHRMRIKWALEQDKLAILTLLMLRGVQTAGELRTRSARMHEFSAIADIESGLQFLIDKFPPLAIRLPRMPGTKEVRYTHLLSGEDAVERHAAASGFSSHPTISEPSSRQDRVTQLEDEVAQLRTEIDSLARQFESFKKQFE